MAKGVTTEGLLVAAQYIIDKLPAAGLTGTAIKYAANRVLSQFTRKTKVEKGPRGTIRRKKFTGFNP